jgi:hypothetical protein
MKPGDNNTDSANENQRLAQRQAKRNSRLTGAQRLILIRHISKAFVGIATAVMMAGSGSNAELSPFSTAVSESSSAFQTNEFVFYDSKSNRFATVTAVLPISIVREPTQGKWRGELSSSYVRPSTNVILASDKLSMTNWNSLICKRDTEKALAVVINLHPGQPDDYIRVDLPVSSATITGHWCYATDAGEVDSGAVVSSIHK